MHGRPEMTSAGQPYSDAKQMDQSMSQPVVSGQLWRKLYRELYRSWTNFDEVRDILCD